ncbi:MAG: universal stress protein [Flavisolibacter sp.]
MKKFIAAFDGLNFSQSTLRYATFLSRRANAHLVGVFLEDFTRHSYGMADVTHYEGSFDMHIREMNQKDREDRDEAIDLFEQACRESGLEFSVHRDRNIALQELLHESVYSDLLIIHSGETMTRFEEKKPSRFIRELLCEVQCPVVLVPDDYRPVDSFCLLYDGAPASVYAVKMFSYLFPGLKNFEYEVVTVKDPAGSLHLPDAHLMKEFMKRHYPGAEYKVLQGDPEDVLSEYLEQENRNGLIVLGAYSRGRVSRWFRASMADVLAKNIQAPLFIAHNKS